MPTTQLILIIHGKLDGKRRLVKLLKKSASLLDCTPLKELEIKRLFQQEMPASALTLFLEKSNYNYAISQQNLQLLKAYANGRDITPDMVEAAIPKSFDENVFALTDLILQGKIQAARDLEADLTRDPNAIIGLLSLLVSNFRLYTQLKIMENLGKTEGQMVDEIGGHPYRIKMARQTIRRFPLTYFKKALSILEQSYYDLLTGRYDKDYLLDLALIKITPSLARNP